jgi:hypothetical protein
VSGPIGSEYPENLAMCLAACFFAFGSIKSARSTLRRRREERGSRTWERTQKAWQVLAGLSLLFFSFFAFALYAVCVNR